jgi:hypothetical protein
MHIFNTLSQIDISLMLLHCGYRKGNLSIDLYGSYCPLSKEFTVEQVALSSTHIDVSNICSKPDFDAFDAYVNERLDGDDFAANLRDDIHDLQHADWLSVGA